MYLDNLIMTGMGEDMTTEQRLTDYINRIDRTGDEQRVSDCVGILEICGYSADYDLLNNRYKIVRLDRAAADGVD